jgi:hypothetical protein
VERHVEAWRRVHERRGDVLPHGHPASPVIGSPLFRTQKSIRQNTNEIQLVLTEIRQLEHSIPGKEFKFQQLRRKLGEICRSESTRDKEKRGKQ